MQGGHDQDLFNGVLFSLFQGLMQLHQVLQDRCFRQDHANQRPDRLLHPLEGKHLGDQQVQDIGLDTCTILQRPCMSAGNRPLVCD